MSSTYPHLFFLLWIGLLSLPALAEEASTPAAESAASEHSPASNQDTVEQAAKTDPIPAQNARALAFDSAEIGLPELPQPMATSDEFKTTLDLIDARLAEQQAALTAAEATAAEADSEPALAASEHAESTAGETAATIENRIQLLRELRIAVQRRATLRGRLETMEADVAKTRQQLETVERGGVALEPPFPISLLDQQQAELALKQALEDVAETRIETATRRVGAAEKALNAAVRERRTARDRITVAESDGIADAEHARLEQALELARLSELLARQRLAAGETAVELARNEDHLVEAQQALLSARIAFLDGRVELPREALDQRIAELSATEAGLIAQIEALQRTGDQAESALYEAQRRLTEAGDDADTAALKEWVAARQSKLVAARTSVDSLTTASANLSRMRALWEQRYQVMNDPKSLDLAALLSQLITETAAARSEKDDIEGRLNALRSIQLAHTRRLRDPDLSDDLREAMAVRSEAHDLAEGYGRELLETQDELIALLQGMRHQVEALAHEQSLSLHLLQAQETIANWWAAEVLVFDDQSIRVRELATALVMFVVVIFLVSLVRIGARRALKRRRVKDTTAEYGDFRLALSAISGNTNQLFVLIAAFYVAMVFSGLASPTVKHWLWTLLVVAFYLQLGIWATAAMVDYFSRRRTRQEMRDPSTVTGYGLLLFFLRVGIWITVGVSLLAYFKYPVAGLVGALGVGSLAIAFAVQNILGDVFSSMAIILDKPFRVGDFVMSGETVGVIENIGVKTTRIRSLSGEQVILSNSDLLSSRIHNFKHFKERRVAFKIRVTYQTPRASIERIPGMIREVIEAAPRTRFDRAHFAEYGEFALVFDVVYYVLSPDYTLYMDVQQAINLGIHQRFEESGVAFAYPTQELLLRRLPLIDDGSASTIDSRA